MSRSSLPCLLLMCLILSACGSGQTTENLAAPTQTSIPTFTPTFTLVPTFTPIPSTPTIYKGIQDPETGHWYLVLQPMNWDEAKDYCSKLGGHLVVIESAEEDNFVYNSVFVPRKDPAILLGATDQDAEGHWVWVTGEELQYTNWAEGEPNNCGDFEILGKCAPENSITYHPDHPSQWNDVPSDNGGDYLCEFES